MSILYTTQWQMWGISECRPIASTRLKVRILQWTTTIDHQWPRTFFCYERPRIYLRCQSRIREQYRVAWEVWIMTMSSRAHLLLLLALVLNLKLLATQARFPTPRLYISEIGILVCGWEKTDENIDRIPSSRESYSAPLPSWTKSARWKTSSLFSFQGHIPQPLLTQTHQVPPLKRIKFDSDEEEEPLIISQSSYDKQVAQTQAFRSLARSAIDTLGEAAATMHAFYKQTSDQKRSSIYVRVSNPFPCTYNWKCVRQLRRGLY